MIASYNQSQKCEEITLLSSKNNFYLLLGVQCPASRMIVENVMVIEYVYSPFPKVCYLGEEGRHYRSKHGTIIPRFSQVSTSQFRKFAELSQESKYDTQTLQWIGASKLFDIINP